MDATEPANPRTRPARTDAPPPDSAPAEPIVPENPAGAVYPLTDPDISGLDHQRRLRAAGDIASNLTKIGFYDIAQHLSTYLIIKRRLPNMYFRQAAEEQSIPPDVYNRWNAAEWPQKFKSRAADPNLLAIVAVLLQVFQEIIAFPEQEDYWTAMQIFRDQVKHLKSSNIAHNRIAHTLTISNQTLHQLLNEDPNIKRRPRHCPWQLRATLDKRSDSLRQKYTRSESDVLDADIESERKQAELLPPDPSLFRTYIASSSAPCTQCGGEPIPRTVQIGPDGTIERHCIYCAHTDFLDPSLALNRAPSALPLPKA